MEVLGVVDVPLTVLFLFFAVSLLYILGKWRFSVLQQYGIKGPKPQWFIGNSKDVREKGLIATIADLTKEYGKVFGIYLGRIPTVVVFDLDILKEILVKDFQNFTDRPNLELSLSPVNKGVVFSKGKDWKRIRSVMSPTFSGGKLKQLCGRINECAVTLSKNLAGPAKKNEVVDVKEYFGAFTMDVIAVTAFGVVVDSQHDFSNPLVTNAKKMMSTPVNATFLFRFAAMFPSLTPLVRIIRQTFFRNPGHTFFVNTVKQLIEQRRQDENKRVDFLQLLLNAEKENKKDGSHESSGHNVDRPDIQNKISTDEIVAQAFIFFIAGYETTASTLRYVSHCLATHPECQDKLIDEIESELGNNEPNYENISNLKYLDCVVNETLRIFPPAITFGRRVLETVTIKGVTFPKGTAVMVPVYNIHHSEDNYEDPEEFKPERFAAKTDMHPLSFIPFGYGPRHCIGMRLALVEVKIALIHVLRKVRFVRMENTQNTIEFRKEASLLTPKVPIRLRVESRKMKE